MKEISIVESQVIVLLIFSNFLGKSNKTNAWDSTIDVSFTQTLHTDTSRIEGSRMSERYSAGISSAACTRSSHVLSSDRAITAVALVVACDLYT